MMPLCSGNDLFHGVIVGMDGQSLQFPKKTSDMRQVRKQNKSLQERGDHLRSDMVARLRTALKAVRQQEERSAEKSLQDMLDSLKVDERTGINRSPREEVCKLLAKVLSVEIVVVSQSLASTSLPVTVYSGTKDLCYM